jgi:hypothetical protein
MPKRRIPTTILRKFANRLRFGLKPGVDRRFGQSGATQ